MSDTEVVIVGAGLAGLACARTLHAAGRSCIVLEASDGIGGRVRSDFVDGYTLDRGFQILLTAYPEARAMLDYAALDLQAFAAGALVRVHDAFVRVGDPLRAPGATWSTLTAPIGSFADKFRIATSVLSARRGPARNLLRRPDRSTRSELEHLGFSPRIIDTFFRPLFAGIQLDPELEVSSRRFWIIWRMLAEGAAAVPAGGMGAIPAQLGAQLPSDAVRLNAPVAALEGTTAILASGERVTGETLVVAVEGPRAAELLDLPAVASRSVACVYFSGLADAVPFSEPVLALDGGEDGPIRNFAIMSNVAPSYAPAGRALMACAIPGGDDLPADDALVDACSTQLQGWFGTATESWEHLRTYRIAHAQPDQRPPFAPKQPVALGHNRYVCGDHRDTASIQGALYSGRRTAEAVLAGLR